MALCSRKDCSKGVVVLHLSLSIGGISFELCVLIKYLISVYSGNNCTSFGAAYPLQSLLIDEENKQIITGCGDGQVRIRHKN